ncbi:MAG: phosphoribosyl-AMP cyclohydrolase [Candidatus Nanopelagicaceae bacterium]|nr:phosphoribosyl-AMP cyclohydrolase [Candidatus Nanopelagicaceae bacterium]
MTSSSNPETNKDFLARFESPDSLLPVVVQNMESKEVLMLAWVNQAALENTIKSKNATFWSRSRNELWVKGETSGNKQEIAAIKFDCDSDAFLYLVHSHGPACHTGENTCFHKTIELPR